MDSERVGDRQARGVLPQRRVAVTTGQGQGSGLYVDEQWSRSKALTVRR